LQAHDRSVTDVSHGKVSVERAREVKGGSTFIDHLVCNRNATETEGVNSDKKMGTAAKILIL